MSDFISVADACKKAGVSEPTVYNFLRSQKTPPAKLGNKFLVPTNQLAALVAYRDNNRKRQGGSRVYSPKWQKTTLEKNKHSVEKLTLNFRQLLDGAAKLQALLNERLTQLEDELTRPASATGNGEE